MIVSLLPGTLCADDLTGSQRFVCTSWQAARCSADGTCESQPPWKLNVPDFVKLDLASKTIIRTSAGPEDRSTRIDAATRTNGLIVLHGQQGERAWAWVINETSGEGTLAITSQGDSITMFSACTPIEKLDARN
jgi:hypothetical protein